MNRFSRALLFNLFFTATITGATLSASPAARADDSAWLNEVQQCIEHLSENKYVFGKDDLDCTKGIAELDCSAFINDVAQAYFSSAWSALSSKAVRPTVSTYYQMVTDTRNANPSVTRVKSMTDLVAGDLIMWEYLGAVQKEKQATGHIMLVLSAAEASASNGRIFKVLVADSAEGGHQDDTRSKGKSGLGIGYIWFKADENGAPTGYSWESPTDFVSNSPIAMGRLVNSSDVASK
jgi:hypothetical protein